MLSKLISHQNTQRPISFYYGLYNIAIAFPNPITNSWNNQKRCQFLSHTKIHKLKDHLDVSNIKLDEGQVQFTMHRKNYNICKEPE